MNNFLQDGEGNLSSKRLVGVVLAGIGILMSITLFIVSLSNPAGDAATALSIISALFTAGATLLGIGVVEGMSFAGKQKDGQ
jgi:hypothetical protein